MNQEVLDCQQERVVGNLIIVNCITDLNSHEYAVAVIENDNTWLSERQLLPVHSQRPRRSVVTGEPSTTSRERGNFAMKKGGISKNIQRRREQRKRRNEARTAAKAFGPVELGRSSVFEWSGLDPEEGRVVL
ncbi:hypothetical protein Aduo_015554 [Ancylostoma duodenale]